jgi:hypothetical protein
LLKELVEGRTVKEAFETAKDKVSPNHRFCCCDHEHHPKCPWIRYINENRLTAEEGHELHATDCGVLCEEKQKHDEGCKIKLNEFDITMN